MNINNTITNQELSRVIGIARRTVDFRAKKDGWTYIWGKVRGGKEKRYLVTGLPVEIRNRIIQSQASDYQKSSVLPARRDLDMNHARAVLAMFDAAPGWSRRRAEARGEIVEAFGRFASGQAVTDAKNSFVARYNAGNDGLGICADTYHIIDKISRASLDLWRAKKRELGLAGLLDASGRGKPKAAITIEMQQYIIGILTQKPHTRPVRISEYLRNKFDQVPHEATVRRFIAKWKEDNKSLFTFIKNPDQWRSNFQASFGDASEKALHFLHMIEFDNTPADVMCADGKRYTITAGIDIFSRKAKCLVVPTSKSTAIANLMRWMILNWGLFDVMISDNGSDYASKHIEAACGALGIDLPPLPPFTPEAKPHIERFFRTLSMQLFEEISGYIGHNVADRKEIESRKSFAQRMFTKDTVIECRLMPDELQAVIDTWVDRVYHQQPHGELGKSPEAKAGESRQAVKKILDERVLDILLAPVGRPTVQTKGIRYQNGRYIAPELIDYIKQKVQVRVDYADAGKLYVFDLESRFVCIAKDAALEGMSVDEIVIAKKRQKKQIREQARALMTLADQVGDPMMELLEARRTAQGGQLFAFRREETFENDAIREAGKAVTEPEAVETFEAETEPAREAGPEKVVKLRKDDEVWFESKLERYKYLTGQKKIRTLTERECGFMEGYEGSEEYYRIFVMPYE